jgi:CRP-like cAMP-binding protein
MPQLQHAASANRLLAALPEQTRQRFLACCDPVELRFGEILCQSGERIRHVYFPTSSFISLVTTLEDRGRLEVGIVGNEGMLGAPLLLGESISRQNALVQGTGTALRMNASRFNRQYDQHAALRRGLNRYVYVLMSQLARTAACIHYHVLEARLARQLLAIRDRAHSNHFRLTHEFLAYMLGVRRVGITQAAGALQARGLIHYRRGQIAILNGAGLEKASCRCYRQENEMYERTVGHRRESHRPAAR